MTQIDIEADAIYADVGSTCDKCHREFKVGDKVRVTEFFVVSELNPRDWDARNYTAKSAGTKQSIVEHVMCVVN